MRGALRFGLPLLLAAILLGPATTPALGGTSVSLPGGGSPAGVGLTVGRAGDALPRVCTDPSPPPSVSVGDCGPNTKVKVILIVETPAGSFEKDVGNCDEDCSQVILVVLHACTALHTAVLEPGGSIQWRSVFVNDTLDFVEGKLDPTLRDPVGRVVSAQYPGGVDNAARECEPADVHLL